MFIQEGLAFQSLIGIQIVCNPARIRDVADFSEFQSLIGIQIVCNYKQKPPVAVDRFVSIPDRDSDCLQRRGSMMQQLQVSFNPW